MYGRWNQWKIGHVIYSKHCYICSLYSSLPNIAIIALERLHATFYPFRHRRAEELGVWSNNCHCLGYIWTRSYY